MIILKIFPQDRSRLIEVLEKLNKRIIKYGGEPLSWEIEEIVEPVASPYSGKKTNVRVLSVKIKGGELKINGWEVLYKLEHTPSGVIVYKIGNHEEKLPEKYLDPQNLNCDHCCSTRHRKYFYVIKKENEWKKIGTGCIKDFVGINIPVKLTNQLSNLTETFEYEFNLSRTIDEFLFYDVVLAAIVSIRKHGWQPASSRTSTARDVVQNMSSLISQATPGEEQEATRIEEWAKKAKGNDFLRNLSIIANNGYVPLRHVAIAVAAVPVYRKEHTSDKNKSDLWIGEVREKIKATVKVVFIKSIYTRYGETNLVIFVDEKSGAKLKTFTKRNFEQGKTYDIVGVVKDHETYNGEKITVITKVKPEK